MTHPQYDAIVVGSGPTGSFAAKELTQQGLKVLVIEAGRQIGAQDFDPNRRKPPQSDINIWERARATLRGQPVQARAAFFSEKMAHFFVNDRKNGYTTDPDTPFLWIRGKQVGGRIHSFGRVLIRWSDDDFKFASRNGQGADWPISYADLAPYYAEVETALGLYGQTDGVPTMPDGVFRHAAQLNPAEQRIKADIETAFPDRRVVTWRYIAPEPDRVPSPLRAAMVTGNMTLRPDTIVREILTDPVTGRATGVVVMDATTRQTETLDAGAVVLCASAIESVRLLHLSRGGKHGAGIGNSTGQLGRYFMDQLPCLAVGAYRHATGFSVDTAAPADPFYGPSGGAFITRGFDAAGHATTPYNYQMSAGRYPGATPDAPARFSAFGFGQMLPAADNRITLSAVKRDAWGLPVPHLRCVLSTADKDALKRQENEMLAMAATAGLDLEFLGSPLGLREMGRGAYPDADGFSRFVFRRWFKRTMIMGAAIHETGGARMGADAGSSVVDPDNRVWDAPNILVPDASSFATSGVTGTTLTSMALAVRACRKLAADLRG